MNRKGSQKMTGQLVVSENVIAKIAGVAAREVPGVAKLVPIPADMRAMVRKDRAAKAVRVMEMDSAMMIDIAIAVNNQVKLTKVCDDVQREVKAAVQNMLGRPVAKVNVIVADIKMEEPQAE